MKSSSEKNRVSELALRIDTARDLHIMVVKMNTEKETM